jgi:hypothetical protein
MGGGREAQQWYGGPGHVSRPATVGGSVRSGVVGGPTGGPGYPRLVIGGVTAQHHDVAMQLISATSEPARRPLGPLVSGTLVGVTLVAGGLSLAYLAFATPLMMLVLPSGRVGPSQMAAGMVVMGMALVAPATFVAVGTSRLARTIASLRPRAGRVSTFETLVKSLPPEVVGASNVTLYDGRTIPSLLVGPFGVVVLRDAPRASVSRVSGSSWEIRTRAGWVPIENPMERATRDAERVRHWLSHDDRDFLVKTYAAVVAGDDRPLERSATCAVLKVGQLPAFIASLPVQRSLTQSRQDGILDQIREAVGGA